MYRTEKTKELVLKGIPESMRGELWLLFSGEQTPRACSSTSTASQSIIITRDETTPSMFILEYNKTCLCQMCQDILPQGENMRHFWLNAHRSSAVRAQVFILYSTLCFWVVQDHNWTPGPLSQPEDCQLNICVCTTTDRPPLPTGTDPCFTTEAAFTQQLLPHAAVTHLWLTWLLSQVHCVHHSCTDTTPITGQDSHTGSRSNNFRSQGVKLVR